MWEIMNWEISMDFNEMNEKIVTLNNSVKNDTELQIENVSKMLWT